MQQTDMTALVTRTEALIDALTGAILSAAQVATERIELAAQVARISQRMAAFASVLEVVGVQKAALTERLTTATGPTRVIIEEQLALLSRQETAILGKAGVPEEAAREAITAVDAAPLAVAGYRRDGRRFVKAEDASRDESRRNGRAGRPPSKGSGHEE